MNLRTQLRSGTGMAKFLPRKQITLLSPSTTLNLSGLHIFDDKKISEKLQKFHLEKIGKNEFELQFKHKTEKEIDSVLELNQTSSSEIFNITHKASYKKLK